MNFPFLFFIPAALPKPPLAAGAPGSGPNPNRSGRTAPIATRCGRSARARSDGDVAVAATCRAVLPRLSDSDARSDAEGPGTAAPAERREACSVAAAAARAVREEGSSRWCLESHGCAAARSILAISDRTRACARATARIRSCFWR